MALVAAIPAQVPGVLDWQVDAACRGQDVELFYNADAERGARKRHRKAAAKAICAGCPVAEACLAWAVGVGEPHGIWGGLSAEERQDLGPGRHLVVAGRTA